MTEFTDEMTASADRLTGIGWFREKITKQVICPFCGSTEQAALAQISALERASTGFEEVSASVHEVPAILDREIADIETELREQEERLNAIRSRQRELEDQSREAAEQRQRLIELYRFVGRLEQALTTMRSGESDSSLAEDVKRLEERLAAIRAILNPAAERRRLDDSLDRVSRGIAKYADVMELPRRSDPIALDIQELTVRFSSETRKDFLWEIGAGQNFMGYHVCTILALQERFLELSSSPVPSFAVFDQPSQVYFPEKWPEDPDPDDPTKKEVPKSKDIEGVNRVFRALSRATLDAGGRFQVIVTDHAPEITWQGVTNIHLVEEWRDPKDFLIPREWMK